VAQVFVRTPLKPKTTARFVGAWWVDAAIFVAFIGFAYFIVGAAARWNAPLTPHQTIDLSPWSLPRYAGLSTMRMAIAYVVALTFSIVYARIAIANRAAERVLIPTLDILQSVPILSFLPGVVLTLIALFPNSVIGLELAAIILIFTSQAWNLAFSFHQSLMTIPKDFSEAATIYHLNFWQRFSRLELPFGTIPLVWNSMMSWAGGWFFLMAAEQFTLGKQSFQLPGLGSYLQVAANRGNKGALFLGLLTLVIVIVLLDRFLWRPAIAWSDRFKVETTAAAEPPQSIVLRELSRSRLLMWVGRYLATPAAQRLDDALSRPQVRAGFGRWVRQERSLLRRIAGALVVVVVLIALVAAIVDALRIFVQVGPG